jgi:hypothetical protein
MRLAFHLFEVLAKRQSLFCSCFSFCYYTIRHHSTPRTTGKSQETGEQKPGLCGPVLLLTNGDYHILSLHKIRGKSKPFSTLSTHQAIPIMVITQPTVGEHGESRNRPACLTKAAPAEDSRGGKFKQCDLLSAPNYWATGGLSGSSGALGGRPGGGVRITGGTGVAGASSGLCGGGGCVGTGVINTGGALVGSGVSTAVLPATRWKIRTSLHSEILPAASTARTRQ